MILWKFLRMTKIKLLSIDVSNYCTKECDFCYSHSRRSGSVLWAPSEIIAFAKDCIANGVEAVSLGGGEPFEYYGIFDIIDELQPLAYLSVTTNGLPLLEDEIWHDLMLHAPDKIHITIHNPDDKGEVNRIIQQIGRLSSSNIKPGVNLLVSNNLVAECKNTYNRLRKMLMTDQIILVPRRFSKIPTPNQLAQIAGNKPFQSASCLLGCKPPVNFASVSWDKRVSRCSYAGGKEKLDSLTFDGLISALDKVNFQSCN